MGVACHEDFVSLKKSSISNILEIQGAIMHITPIKKGAVISAFFIMYVGKYYFSALMAA